MPQEKITRDKEDNFHCLCGNLPWEAGFYPCNTRGETVEPTPEKWKTNYYVCDKCKRFFDIDTLIVVGVQNK